MSCQTTDTPLKSVYILTRFYIQNIVEQEAHISIVMNYCFDIVSMDHGTKPTNAENETSSERSPRTQKRKL